MEERKSLKQYCKEAKKRLKCGFWQTYQHDLNKNIERAEQAGISTSKVKQYYAERVSENIKNYTTEKEEFYLGKNLDYYTSLKEKVDYILLQMDKELSKVIYNEYLLSNNSNWWIYMYSKSTYYRMKNKAMNLFLEWWYA